MKGNKTFPVEVEFDEILTSTKMTTLVRINGTVHWIATSKIKEINMKEKTFVIPNWLAKEKGLI